MSAHMGRRSAVTIQLIYLAIDCKFLAESGVAVVLPLRKPRSARETESGLDHGRRRGSPQGRDAAPVRLGGKVACTLTGGCPESRVFLRAASRGHPIRTVKPPGRRHLQRESRRYTGRTAGRADGAGAHRAPKLVRREGARHATSRGRAATWTKVFGPRKRNATAQAQATEGLRLLGRSCRTAPSARRKVCCGLCPGRERIQLRVRQRIV